MSDRLPTSHWQVLNTQKIENLLRQLEIYDFSGSYGGEINLKEVIRIIKGANEEIDILSRKVERLEIQLENEKNKDK